MLNGENLTDRDVLNNSALYNDRLTSTLSNNKIKINNYLSDNLYITTPIPQKTDSQVLQLNLNSHSIKYNVNKTRHPYNKFLLFSILFLCLFSFSR